MKSLTSRDTVTVRKLFCEPFDFRPEFKLWLSTNHKPEIRGQDDAIWDRIRLVPFTQRFEGANADDNLPEKLRAELPGVFAWMVEGCLDWQRKGLGEPDQVIEATREYRAQMDILSAFFEDCCVIGEELWAPATPLHKACQEWCREQNEDAESQRAFGTRLSERGFQSFVFTSGPYKARKGWRGIGLRVDDSDPTEGTMRTNRHRTGR